MHYGLFRAQAHLVVNFLLPYPSAGGTANACMAPLVHPPTGSYYALGSFEGGPGAIGLVFVTLRTAISAALAAGVPEYRFLWQSRAGSSAGLEAVRVDLYVWDTRYNSYLPEVLLGKDFSDATKEGNHTSMDCNPVNGCFSEVLTPEDAAASGEGVWNVGTVPFTEAGRMALRRNMDLLVSTVRVGLCMLLHGGF